MNILFISHTANKTGAENVLVDVIRAVATSSSHHIFVALPNDGKTALSQALCGIRIADIKHFMYRSARNTTLFFLRNIGYGFLFGLPKLKHYCKANKIDVIYINSSVNIIGVLLAQRLRVPYIWHIHEHSTAAHRWTPVWMDKYYRKWFFNSCCRSVFVSNTSREQWEKNLRVSSIPQSVVIYSGYMGMSKVSKKQQPHTFTFGFLGTLAQNKNVSTLIRAFQQQQGAVKLLIGGDGEWRKVLMKQANNIPGVTFAGPITDRYSFYNRVDVLVIPSFNESWGLVALEGMSAGIPLIITKNTGLVELFTNNKECIFIDPFDVNDLSKAMTCLREDHSFAEYIVSQASSRLEGLALNQIFAAKIMEIIHQSKK
jgi:glycosyltransferase involved in cell wall biosynthesis